LFDEKKKEGPLEKEDQLGTIEEKTRLRGAWTFQAIWERLGALQKRVKRVGGKTQPPNTERKN